MKKYLTLTIDSESVRNHFNVLVGMGVSREELEDILGSSFQTLDSRDGRIPFIKNLKMIENGMKAAGTAIPFRLGTLVSLEQIGVCGHILKNCDSLKEAVHLFIRYQRLLYGISAFEISIKGNQLIISHTIAVSAFRHYSRILAELNLTSVLYTMRKLINKDIIPNEVHFSYPKPENIKDYESFFQAPLIFDQKTDAMVFYKDLLTRKIPKGQPYIKEILIQHADELLKKLENNNDFKSQVGKLALEYMPRGDVDIKLIADKLNMSRWTLARKLKTEGVTFRDLIKSFRKEMALNYLENKTLSITDITFLLGYSEESAFRRAFKAWTGINPYEYRKNRTTS